MVLSLILLLHPARAMVVIDERASVRREATPHGAIGISTAYSLDERVRAK